MPLIYKSSGTLAANAAKRSLVLRNITISPAASLLTKCTYLDYNRSVSSPLLHRSLGCESFQQSRINMTQMRQFTTSGSRLVAAGADSASSSSDPGTAFVQAPSPPPLRGYTLLENRALIAIGGPDTSKFLNGIVSNKIESYTDQSFDDTKPIYCTFLNSKGRMIADSFIYPVHSNDRIRTEVSKLLPDLSVHNPTEGTQNINVDVEYLIECDADVAAQLFTTLKLYRLRQQVSIAKVPSSLLQVWSVWDDTPVSEALNFLDPCNTSLYMPGVFEKTGYATFQDVRVLGFGLRMLLENKVDEKGERITPATVFSKSVVSAEPALEPAPLVAYDIRRILFGIPEGIKELPVGKALPLENCFDYMNGIHFNKGCYVGQELTIRSYHHGVVRKRVIPVVFHMENKTQTIEEEAENETDLAYNPESPVAQQIDTAHALVGKEIINEAAVEGEDSTPSGESPFAPSPFGDSGTRKKGSRRNKNAAGVIISAVGNVGLALVRLEQFGAPGARLVVNGEQELVKDGAEVGFDKVGVVGFQPFWWPQPEM